MSCNQFGRVVSRNSPCSSNFMDTVFGFGSRCTLWDIILDWRRNAPCGATHFLMVRRVIVLVPEPEFQMVRQRLICPRNVLICIQQGPHMMTGCLPSNIRADITCWIVLCEQVRAWLWSALVTKANTSTSFVFQVTLGIPK